MLNVQRQTTVKKAIVKKTAAQIRAEADAAAKEVEAIEQAQTAADIATLANKLQHTGGIHLLERVEALEEKVFGSSRTPVAEG